MAAGRTSALFKRLTGSSRAVPADLPHFSYATGEHTLLKRAVIQLVERLTGAGQAAFAPLEQPP